jgi:site-specific DNA-methyltransferase (adenine-specific)
MEWLCRLTATPTGGVVLDPFAGSGSTLVACLRARRRFVGIEQDGHYCEIARWRVEAARRETAQGVLFE